MQPFEFVLAILAIVFGARLIRDFMRHRADAAARLPDDDLRMMAQELARLRERVQVLERVVTDGRQASDLDREIDRLRDR